jgi:hypothetical protein
MVATTAALQPQYAWYYQGELVGTSSTLELIVPALFATGEPLPSLQVTDLSTGCNKTITQPDNILITSPPTPLLVNTFATPASSINSNNGFIALSVIGGISPYQTIWSPALPGNAPINLAPGTYCFTVTDAGGCAVSDCVTIDYISSATDLEEDGFRLNPNPIVGGYMLHLTLPTSFLNEKIHYTLSDMQGRKVVEQSLENGSQHIDIQTLTTWSPGVYMLLLQSGDEYLCKRILLLSGA